MQDWFGNLVLLSMQRDVPPAVKDSQWWFTEEPGGFCHLVVTGDYVERLEKVFSPSPDHALAHGLWQADRPGLYDKAEVLTYLIPCEHKILNYPEDLRRPESGGNYARCGHVVFKPVDWEQSFFSEKNGFTRTL